MSPTAEKGLSGDDLEKARRDFRALLRRKRLSRRWIEEHADDLLAQVCAEYAAKTAAGARPRSPVGWLVNGAWWRAQDLLESEGRRPASQSLEGAFDLADSSAPGPEQLAIDRDRAARLQGALAALSERERRLLALVYAENHSLRAAGEKVGWRKSTASRRHEAAMARLRSLLGDERDLLSPAPLALALTVLGALRRATGNLAAVAERRLAELWRRISPLADPGAPAAAGGGGRVLGACGVAAASLLCGVAVTGVVPNPRATPGESAARAARPAASTVSDRTAASSAGVRAPAEEPASAPRTRIPRAQKPLPATRPEPERRERRPAAAAPPASTAQTIEEFGVEAGAAPPRPSTPAPIAPTGGDASSASGSGEVAEEGASPHGSASSGAEFGL